MGEYFTHVLSITLVAFSSWLAIKLKFSENENEIKNSIKKLFIRLIYAAVFLFYLYDLYVLKTSSAEITRNEVFRIAFNIAVIFFVVLSFFILRLTDFLVRWLTLQSERLTHQSEWLTHQNDFNKQHFDLTKSIREFQVSTANKSLKQDK
jgi:FlaA1/EpsC-like NDP-sugar epimerase